MWQVETARALKNWFMHLDLDLY